MENLDLSKLDDIRESMNVNREKFVKGNKSAGVRLRKDAMELIKFGKAIRVEVSEINNLK